LGDIGSGKTVFTDIGVDIDPVVESRKFTILATAQAINSNSVSAPAEVEVERVIVLAETGFSILEFLFLLMALMISTSTAIYLKKVS
jgi:hypothetical protein